MTGVSWPVPSRGLRSNPRAVSAPRRLHRWRIEHGPSRPGAASGAGPRDRPRPALSRPRPGRRCGVNCPEGQFNITGCCSHSPHSQAELARCERVRATPVMSCAPQRLRRRLKGVRPLQGKGRMYRSQAPQAAQSWSLAPTRPPIRPPRGLPRCGSHQPLLPPPSKLALQAGERSAVLAASRVRG